MYFDTYTYIILCTYIYILYIKYTYQVVLTNEITTRFNFYNDGLVPALGETYAQMINLRLMLGTGINNERIALVDKNSHINKHCAPFEVSLYHMHITYKLITIFFRFQ